MVTYGPAISAGGYHNLALCRNGTVIAWMIARNGGWGQTEIPPGLSNITAIAAGTDTSMVILQNGSVVMWGNPKGDYKYSVWTGLTDVKAISTGEMSSALLKNGTYLTNDIVLS